MEQRNGWCPKGKAQSTVTSLMNSVTLCILFGLMVLVGSARGAPRALPSESDSPSSDSSNSVGMFVTIPRANDSDDDVINYYIPVVMAEMPAPISEREPAVIVVQGCRGNQASDPSGACRRIFSFPSYPKRPSSPSRPRLPPRPRVVPQTQRDLVRRFNPNRRRNSWFGRSLSSGSGESSSSSSSSSSYSVDITTTESPSTVRTTTPDHDD